MFTYPPFCFYLFNDDCVFYSDQLSPPIESDAPGINTEWNIISVQGETGHVPARVICGGFACRFFSSASPSHVTGTGTGLPNWKNKKIRDASHLEQTREDYTRRPKKKISFYGSHKKRLLKKLFLLKYRHWDFFCDSSTPNDTVL